MLTRTTLLAFISLTCAGPLSAQIYSISTKPATRDTAHATNSKASEDACRQIALTFEDAVKRGDASELERTIDTDALLERATAGVPASEKARREFKDGALEGLRGVGGILPNLIASVKAGGTVRFLRIFEAFDGHTALLRLAHADDSAPEYIELVLRKTTDGGARAVDVWTSREGALHSLTLRRWLLAIVADVSKTLPDKLSIEDRRWAQNARAIDAMNQAFAEGRNADALKAWNNLPEELHRDPALQITRLFAARARGREEFQRALIEARQAVPRNAGVELLAADAALLDRHPTEALFAIQGAEAAIGGDAYLLALRGSVSRSQGELITARRLCEKAVELEPDLEDAYWTLLGIANEEERFEDVLVLLAKIDSLFNIDWRTFEDSNAYSKFLETPFGQRWRARIASSK